MSLGKKPRGKRTVSKKISPKRNPNPELKLLFEKIRAKKEAKETAMLDQKERKMNPKSFSIFQFLRMNRKMKKGQMIKMIKT